MDDLAKSLAAETGKNAIIVTAVERPKLDKFQFDTGSPDNLASSIYAGAKLRMSPGTDPVFSDRSFSADHFRELLPQAPGHPEVAKAAPDDLLVKGKVTLETAGKLPIALSSLTAVKWSKALRVDPLMDDMAVSASVKDMSETDFLGEVARGAGGFLTSDDKGFHIAYDPNQFKAHVENALKLEVPSVPPQPMDAKRDFYAGVINVLPFETLDPLFLTIGLESKLDVLPNSDLAQLSITYIKAVESVPSRPLGGTPDGGVGQLRGRAGRSDILSRVDNRATVHLRFNGSGEIVLSVPVIQGRQSSYIDM